MMQPLHPVTLETAQKIQVVWHASYAIEAELLGAKDFPPLQRTMEDFMASDTEFFGYMIQEELAAVVEIRATVAMVHIQSFVVHPNFFRQGIGAKCMEFVLHHYTTPLFMVETGVDNGPAIALYQKFGFHEVKQWNTELGIRKIRLKRGGNGSE